MGIDPIRRIKYNQKNLIARFNNDIYDNFSPDLNNVIKYEDSTLFFNSYFFSNIDRNIPNIIAGFILGGSLDGLTFAFEPVVTNKHYNFVNLGSNYSRNNYSFGIGNAFLKYSKNKIDIIFGRYSLWWGESINASIIQSAQSPSYDNLLIRYRNFGFTFDILIGELNPEKSSEGKRINRNIAGHRLKMQIGSRLTLGLGEHIIYTGENRGAEIAYLNPYIPYFFIDGIEGHNKDYDIDNDNSIIFADFRYKVLSDAYIFGELIIDDIQIDKTGRENALGIKIGFDMVTNLKSNKILWVFELTSISPWTYIHHGQYTSWQNKGHPIGYKYGPDSKSIMTGLQFFKDNYYGIIINMEYLQKGSNDLNTIWNNGLAKSKVENKYLAGELGLKFQKKWGFIEAGFTSKNYLIDSVVLNKKINQSESLYIRVLFNIINNVRIY